MAISDADFRSVQPWRQAAVVAGLLSAALLAITYYWFGMADRYAVFLYGHSAVNLSAAEPFDAITSSRYWMAGLVASGGILVAHTFACWAWGRLRRRTGGVSAVPDWRRVWLLCAPVLIVGIPAITMTANSPVLPWSLALACTLATLAGLALALWPGAWAADRPRDLVWLAADGVGLAPVLMLLRAVELPGRGLAVSPAWAWFAAIASILTSAGWLLVMTLLRRWRRTLYPRWSYLLAAGLSVVYLLLPLLHHLTATPPGFRYITAASNFFAFALWLQALALAIAAGMALGTTQLRRRVLAAWGPIP